MLLYIKCVFWFPLQLFYATFLILRIIKRDITINVHRPWCKVSFLLVRFQWKLNFSKDFRKKKITKYLLSRKSVPWEPSFMRTDTPKVTVAFRNFANAPKKGRQCTKTRKRLITLSQKSAMFFLCISGLSVKHGTCDHEAFSISSLNLQSLLVVIHTTRHKIKKCLHTAHTVFVFVT